jgi:hypothetical protein
VPYAPELNPDSFTVALWARPDGGGAGHRSPITSRYDGIVTGTGNNDGYIIYIEPGGTWQFWTGPGESRWDSLAGSPALFDEWQHVAITFDMDTFTRDLYIDGVLDATTTDQAYAPVTEEDRDVHIGSGGDTGTQYQWLGEIDDIGLWNEVLSEEQIISVMENGVASLGGGVTLKAGDANMDLQFDQLDLVQVQIAAKYLSAQNATWGEGDWNGAPGGAPGDPPAGDGKFDQLDIIAALNADVYLTGPYAAIGTGGARNDGQTSITYDPATVRWVWMRRMVLN